MTKKKEPLVAKLKITVTNSDGTHTTYQDVMPKCFADNIMEHVICWQEEQVCFNFKLAREYFEQKRKVKFKKL